VPTPSPWSKPSSWQPSFHGDANPIQKRDCFGTSAGIPGGLVRWARQYLVWEGLLSSEKRGIWQLTQKGRDTKLTEADGREIFKKWVAIHADERKEKQGIPKNAVPGEQHVGLASTESYQLLLAFLYPKCYKL
jgi:restriction endonuclease Mrr